MAVYDVIIIGAGPAGLTAGLYSARAGLKTAIVSRNIGGTANRIKLIENWPGFSGSGSSLIKKMHNQLKKFDVDFILEDVLNIEKANSIFHVQTKNKKIEGKAIILTTGRERKTLGVKGEEKLIGKGVSYCVTCDAFFFKNKNVAFVADKKMPEDEKVLSRIAKKVYTIKPKDLKEIKGKEKVESIIINENGKEKEIKLDGIFIEIGSVPLAEFARNLKLNMNKENHIIVDEDMHTSADGVFAAGDVTNLKVKQVLTSSAQGAIAGKVVSDWLKNR